MYWTEERVEILKRRWGTGCSAAKIAEELGNTTRNAVIGKVHRLGLSKKLARKNTCKPKQNILTEPQSADINNNQKNKKIHPKKKSTLHNSEEEPEVEPISDTEAARLAEDTSSRLSLMELTTQTCKWPIGDPSKSEFWFCGHPSEPGKPYCAAHSRISEQLPPTKKARNYYPTSSQNSAKTKVS